MSPTQPITVIFGAARVGVLDQFKSDTDLATLYATLEKHSIKNIDTAQIYGDGDSEDFLGKTKAGERFIIDTKWPGGWRPGSAIKENIITSAKESIQKLGVPKVDIFYIHSPDAATPISETLAGVNEVYKAGLFERFGLSNFPADEVQKVYDYSKEHGYVLPTVYQGNYSPVARKQETLLFPTLRRLGLAFYAYSPLAGGFLTKTRQQILEGAGRFSDQALGGMYRDMYCKPSYLAALEHWEDIAKEQGSSRSDLAYRWVAYHSPLKHEQGDGIIIGASSLQQLEQTLQGIEAGPLSDPVVQRIDELWEGIQHEAPLDNFSR